MSAPVDLEHKDGLYSKLPEEEGAPYENFSGSPSSVSLSVDQRRPQSPGPGLYETSTVALAVVGVVLLIGVITVSTHNNLSSDSGTTHWLCPRAEAVSPPTEQDLNVSELQEVIEGVQEKRRLWEKTNTTEVAPPPSTTCPADWLSFNHSCYFVSRFSLSWSISQQYCVEQGGHLAIILTPEEQMLLWDLLPDPVGFWSSFWIGIRDRQTEGHWTWVDRTALVGGFWEEGQPSGHMDWDCGYIRKSQNLKRGPLKSWSNYPCDSGMRFVCETNTQT